MTMVWKKVSSTWVDPDTLGYIPNMLSDKDARSAVAQINEAYQYGGGFQPFDGFSRDRETGILTYPDDPPLRPLFSSQLRDEKIEVYEYGWVCVSQKDGTFQVARID